MPLPRLARRSRNWIRLSPLLLCSPLLALAALHASPRLAPAMVPQDQSQAAQDAPQEAEVDLDVEELRKLGDDEAMAQGVATSPPSRADLDLGTLRRLFEQEEMARLQLSEGTSARAGAAEASARTAADVAWKLMSAGDVEAASPWLSRRRELRLEAYRTRRALIESRMARIESKLQRTRQVLEAALAGLQRDFPDLHAEMLKALARAGLPSRPTESSLAVQALVMERQKAEHAAYKKAHEGKDDALAARAFGRATALDRVLTALSARDILRLLRGSLAAQRWSLMLAFGQRADAPALAAQDLRARREELRAASEVGEPPAVLLAKKVELALALDSDAREAARRGQVEAALREQDEAIALRRSLPPSHPESTLATPFRALGSIHNSLGQVKAAREFYQKALAETERAKALRTALPDAPALPDSPASATQRARARALAREGSNLDEGVLLNNLALLTAGMGDVSEGLALLDRARALVQNIGAASSGVAGADPKSDRDFADSIARVRRSLLATTRSNRAVMLLDAGRSKGAEAELREVASEFRALGEDEAAATVLLNVAGTYFDAGREDPARQHTRQARAFFASAQDERGMLQATGFLAKLSLRANRLDESEHLAAQTLALARASGDLSWQAAALRAQARIEILRAQPQGALQVLAEVHELDRKTGAPLDAVRTLALEGEALGAQASTREAAIRCYKQATALLEARPVRSGASAFGDADTLSETYEPLARLLIESGRGEEAFDTLSRARSQRLRDGLRLDAIQTRDATLQALLLRVQDAEDKLNALRSALASEQSQTGAERDGKPVEALRRQVALAEGEFLRLTRELARENPAFSRVISVRPELLRSRQAEIPADTALVQFVPLGRQMYIFVITRSGLRIFAPPVDPAEVERRVREFRSLMDQARASFERGADIGIEDWSTQRSSAPLRDNLTALYSMLIAPIEAEVRGKGTLAFIPAQSLFYLPLHALARRTPSGLRFLIQDKRVAYLSSDNALNFVREQRPGVGAGIVALGDPKGANLPFAAQEARAVAQIFRAARQDAQLVQGQAATKAALLSPRNERKRVWHLATHGILNPKNPLRSYIQLASGGGTSAGRLTLGEVWGLDLKRVDLVTLSACQTALGEREPSGSEIASLADAFSGAGAQSVMASLWSVADDSTSALMTRFYRSLASGKGKAQSLQDAELALLSRRETNHPFFWAPFVLMGDWR